MRLLIVGSSPLAVYLAAQSTAIGQPVPWLADLFTTEAIRRTGGVHLYQDQARRFIPNVRITASFEETFSASYDALLFTMPGYLVNDLLFKFQVEGVRPPPIVSLQRGVGNYERIVSLYGADQVLRGALSLNLSHPILSGKQPHVVPEYVVREFGGGIGLDAAHPLSEPIAAWLRSLGMSVMLDKGHDLAWSALFWQIYANAVPTLLDMPFSEIRQNPTLFRIEYRQLREALTIIEALGVRLIDLPGAPVNALANQLQLWPYQWLPGRLIAPSAPPGLRHELALRIPHSEAAYLNGAVAIHANNLDLHAPINHVLALTVQDIAEDRAAWSQFRRDTRSLEALIGIAAGHMQQ